MPKETRRIRLSIDLDEKEYRELRVVAALYGESVRDYVLKSIRESVDHGVKKRELAYLADNVVKDPVLKEFWKGKTHTTGDETD